MTLRLRDPESPVKSLPQSPRRLDTPQSPRDISTSLTEIPTFCPTEEEFQRPLQYIQSIAPRAEPYGMCKIIPPSSWKVKACSKGVKIINLNVTIDVMYRVSFYILLQMEGKISDDVRFTSQKQYTHKLYQR